MAVVYALLPSALGTCLLKSFNSHDSIKRNEFNCSFSPVIPYGVGQNNPLFSYTLFMFQRDQVLHPYRTATNAKIFCFVHMYSSHMAGIGRAATSLTHSSFMIIY
jgi:hypothetical protein